MNDRQSRQEQLLTLLRESGEPLRGEDLALVCGVTRQIIVHEIALLRAAGIPIVSTPRGYRLERTAAAHQQTVIAVRHRPEQTAAELYTLVDHGIVVDNVIVDHAVYGELRGNLQLRSRLDVEQFLAQIHEGRAALLSSLTEGYHLHTLTYQRKADLADAIAALRSQSIDVID